MWRGRGCIARRKVAGCGMTLPTIVRPAIPIASIMLQLSCMSSRRKTAMVVKNVTRLDVKTQMVAIGKMVMVVFWMQVTPLANIVTTRAVCAPAPMPMGRS